MCAMNSSVVLKFLNFLSRGDQLKYETKIKILFSAGFVFSPKNFFILPFFIFFIFLPRFFPQKNYIFCKKLKCPVAILLENRSEQTERQLGNFVNFFNLNRSLQIFGWGGEGDVGEEVVA